MWFLLNLLGVFPIFSAQDISVALEHFGVGQTDAALPVRPVVDDVVINLTYDRL